MFVEINPPRRPRSRNVQILLLLFAAALLVACSNQDYNAGVKLALDGHYPQAYQHYLKSARNGYTPGMMQVANYLVQGRGVPKDQQQAEDWYLRAYRAGDESAILILGKFYLAQQRYQDALVYLRLGLRTRDGETVYLLARCYELGQGTGKDLPQAIKYYTLAANLNYFAADRKLHQLGVDTWDTPGSLDLPVYSLYLIAHPSVWFTLLFLNLLLLPVYIKTMFQDWQEFAGSLQLLFQGRSLEERVEIAAAGETDDSGFDRFKIVMWFVFYLAVVTAQYKLLTFIFY